MFKALIKRLRKDQRGLTLIELLVVIVILGIIAAIAVPMIMGNQDNAHKNTNAQNEQILQDAINRYYIDKSQFPTNATTLNDQLITATGTPATGPYVKAIPTIKAFTGCTPATGAGTINGWNYASGVISAPTGCK